MATGQADSSVINIVTLRTQEEFARVVELQREIWGFSDVELLPVRFFIVATKVGGFALGAYDGDRMIGFCFAVPGIKPAGAAAPQSYLHSNMLGVRPEYHNRGVGRLLKLRQREIAMESVNLIEWTFDPLELKNARFNIEVLGAIVRRWVANQYGMTSSHLHGNLPTDRLVAEWWLDSERARLAAERKPFSRPPVEATVVIPAEISRLRKEDPRQAREIQRSAGEAFSTYFAQGMAVTGIEIGRDAGTYQLGFLP